MFSGSDLFNLCKSALIGIVQIYEKLFICNECTRFPWKTVILIVMFLFDL